MGGQVQKLLGRAWTDGGRLPTGHYTRRTADEALQTILADARRGTIAGMRPTGATFAAAEYLRYVKEVRRIDAATASDYKGVVNGYLVPEFGQLPLESITPDTIDAYKERLIAEARLSSRVIVRPLTVMHGVFKRSKRVWGLERPASADLVERPQVVYSGEYDTSTATSLSASPASAHEDQDAAIYKVAAFTGLRQGELLALRWHDVDFVGGLLHVRAN
jgi:integrase